mgnify:CR=1 FL=1
MYATHQATSCALHNLPAGTLALSLAYSAETGLELVARLEPRLLAVPLPAIPPPPAVPRPPS